MAFKIMALSDGAFHLINEDVGDPDIFVVPVRNGMQIVFQQLVLCVQAPTHLRATLLQQALEALLWEIPVNDWDTAQAKLFAAARQCMSD